MKMKFEMAPIKPEDDPKIQEAIDHAIKSVLSIRCAKHYQVKQQNTNEHSGGECGGCIAEERDFYKLQYEAIKIEINLRIDEITALKSENSILRHRVNELRCALLDSRAIQNDALEKDGTWPIGETSEQH